MEQNNNDPIKSPIIQEIIMSNRIGRIAAEIAERMNIKPSKALEIFYASKTCADFHNRETGLYLYSELYVADEFIRESKMTESTF